MLMCICATSPNSDHDSNCKKVDVPCCTSFFAQHATPTYVDQRENVCEGGTLLPALARVSGRRWTCDGSRVQRKGPVGGARRRSPSGFALTAWWNVCSPQAILRKHVHAVVIVDVLELQLENCSCLAMGASQALEATRPACDAEDSLGSTVATCASRRSRRQACPW